MNSTLLKDSDIDINAYLNSLSLHQSFEEEDSEDDDYLSVNPSGSVLLPACNPYNKQKKIAEANETLFAEEVAPRSPQRVQFNKVEKRICYDYFGSSFESDSIKSYEEEESEKEIIQKNANEKIESNFDVKGTHLQPQAQNPASKVIVTVSPRKEEEHHSESESEDVCVGTVEKNSGSQPDLKASNKEEDREKETNVPTSKQNVKNAIPNKKSNENQSHQSSNNKENEIECKETYKSKEVQIAKKDARDSSILGKNKVEDIKHTEKYKVEEVRPSQIVKTHTIGKNANASKDKNDKVAFIDLGSNDRKRSNSPNKEVDFYPCLANHSGITIRITGADSIESVESENTDNEAQMLETFSFYNGNNKINQESSFPAPKEKDNSIKINETTLVLSNQTFILKGTKSNQNIRSQKPKRYETGPKRKTESNVGEKALNKSKPNETEKTEQPTSPKMGKHSSTTKANISKRNKSKSDEEGSKETSTDCQSCDKKVRPKSSVDRGSMKVKTVSRPKTAPAKRSCCQWGNPHLPEYNGLRSEYGLSAEQLMERKRHKMETIKAQKQKKEQKSLEEIKKRKENEATFIAWLDSKRKQAQEQYLRNQRLQAESGIKIYPAPTAHLKRTKAVRNRKMFKSDRKCISLEELLDKASSHEKKTYRIYLGLSFDD